MHLIVCIDDRDGMSFCGRRLSRDAALTAHILELTKGSRLWMTADSAKLFPNGTVIVDDHCLQLAGEGEFCFAEVKVDADIQHKLESVYLYHWNRAYPSTTKFPRELLMHMHLVQSEDFPGNSHEIITLEKYEL